MIDARTQEIKDKESKKQGFADWMNQPATRMMVSMIPAGEKPEVLETLLQATFNAGFGKGAGITAIGFLEAIRSSMDRRPK